MILPSYLQPHGPSNAFLHSQLILLFIPVQAVLYCRSVIAAASMAPTREDMTTMRCCLQEKQGLDVSASISYISMTALRLTGIPEHVELQKPIYYIYLYESSMCPHRSQGAHLRTISEWVTSSRTGILKSVEIPSLQAPKALTHALSCIRILRPCSGCRNAHAQMRIPVSISRSYMFQWVEPVYLMKMIGETRMTFSSKLTRLCCSTASLVR